MFFSYNKEIKNFRYFLIFLVVLFLKRLKLVEANRSRE